MRGRKMAKRGKSFRLEESTIEHLDYLSKLLKTSSTSLIETLINVEFDKINGNPKLQEVIHQMNQLKSVMENYKNVVINDNPEGVIDWNEFAIPPSKSGRNKTVKSKVDVKK